MTIAGEQPGRFFASPTSPSFVPGGDIGVCVGILAIALLAGCASPEATPQGVLSWPAVDKVHYAIDSNFGVSGQIDIALTASDAITGWLYANFTIPEGGKQTGRIDMRIDAASGRLISAASPDFTLFPEPQDGSAATLAAVVKHGPSFDPTSLALGDVANLWLGSWLWRADELPLGASTPTTSIQLTDDAYNVTARKACPAKCSQGQSMVNWTQTTYEGAKNHILPTNVSIVNDLGDAMWFEEKHRTASETKVLPPMVQLNSSDPAPGEGACGIVPCDGESWPTSRSVTRGWDALQGHPLWMAYWEEHPEATIRQIYVGSSKTALNGMVLTSAYNWLFFFTDRGGCSMFLVSAPSRVDGVDVPPVMDPGSPHVCHMSSRVVGGAPPLMPLGQSLGPVIAVHQPGMVPASLQVIYQDVGEFPDPLRHVDLVMAFGTTADGATYFVNASTGHLRVIMNRGLSF